MKIIFLTILVLAVLFSMDAAAGSRFTSPSSIMHPLNPANPMSMNPLSPSPLSPFNAGQGNGTESMASKSKLTEKQALAIVGVFALVLCLSMMPIVIVGIMIEKKRKREEG